MNFEEQELFHVYNQGNNRQKIFFEERHYEYFMHKLEYYILPYSDILAWCLMPNHFHLMIHVKNLEAEFIESRNRGVKETHITKKRTLNDSIGIALRSYARGINARRGSSGSLFRNNTKASKVSSLEGIMPSLYRTKNIGLLRGVLDEKQYPQICLNYIHMNPVRAKLVKRAIDWKFSSARDFAKIRESRITDVNQALKLVGSVEGLT